MPAGETTFARRDICGVRRLPQPPARQGLEELAARSYSDLTRTQGTHACTAGVFYGVSGSHTHVIRSPYLYYPLSSPNAKMAPVLPRFRPAPLSTLRQTSLHARPLFASPLMN